MDQLFETKPLPEPYAGRAMSRASDPVTSKRAAAKARKSGMRQSHADRMVAALLEHGPMTPHQMTSVVNLTVEQIDRRGKEMEEAGRIKRTDIGEKSVQWEALR